jgi:hypothetical protein
MCERNIDPTDVALRNSVVFKVVQALRHAARRKIVVMVEKRKGICVWAAAPGPHPAACQYPFQARLTGKVRTLLIGRLACAPLLSKRWSYCRRSGEALSPEREPLHVLDALKLQLGTDNKRRRRRAALW